MPFSVGTYSSVNLTTPTTTKPYQTKNVAKTVCSIKLSSNKQQKQETIEENPKAKVFLNRREALGFGLCFGLVDVLQQPSPRPSAALEAPCELTVSPSGLAFCDKVVGKGPEAVKGQLIKVIIVCKFYKFCTPNLIKKKK